MCKCEPIGCDWKGCWSKLLEHETDCEFLNKAPEELIQCLEAKKAANAPANLEQTKLLDLLSGEDFSFTGYL